jgi:hypothetical protein
MDINALLDNMTPQALAILDVSLLEASCDLLVAKCDIESYRAVSKLSDLVEEAGQRNCGSEYWDYFWDAITTKNDLVNQVNKE